MQGLVIKNTGSWYIVLTDEGATYECKVKGNFRLKGIRSTNPVAVGDRVAIVPTEGRQGTAGEGESTPRAFITEIADRKNYIIRKASNLSKQSSILAANVDMAYLVVTVAHPATSTTFIDRFLASAEAYGVPVTIVINKVDLLQDDGMAQLHEWERLYTDIGYKVLRTCALMPSTGILQGVTPLTELRTQLAGKVSLFAGNSGVGKSTLLSSLIPGLNLKTAEISEAHDTGMHTTTFSEMFALTDDADATHTTDGGWVIDTPGVRGFGTFNIEREEVGHYFRDIFTVSADCRFGGCTHTHEPGCAVQQAVAEGRIAESRFASYLSMLDDKEEGKYR